jgi:uncharacterized protein
MVLVNPYNERIKKLDDVKDMSFWASDAIDLLRKHMECDPTHDEAHIVRVLRNTLWFGQGGDIDVMVPAAICHDIVNVPKDHPDRKNASLLSAKLATVEIAKSAPFRHEKHEQDIFHAIQAHSWSAKIEPKSLEAKALQDADRIDALGHIGIIRMFATGGKMGRALFHPTDPLAIDRPLDENTYTLDHFYVKLNKLSGTMCTDQGKELAEHLTMKMAFFIKDLIEEL